MKFNSVTPPFHKLWRYLVAFGELRKNTVASWCSSPWIFFLKYWKMITTRYFSVGKRQYTIRRSVTTRSGGACRICPNKFWLNLCQYEFMPIRNFTEVCEIIPQREQSEVCCLVLIFPAISLCCSSPLFYYLIAEPVLFHIHALLPVASLVNLMLTT